MSEISLSMIVISIAGGVSVFALLLSKLLVFLNARKSEKQDSSKGYECGFDADLKEDFVYLTEKVAFIPIYLVFELVTSWLLLCCAFDVMKKDWSGKLFIKVFLIAIIVIILISYKFLFYRNTRK